ncbi:APC family permease [Tunturiibacter gelidoferens]|uniref:Amino acid transporter n=1 Tax=Tunturiibacter gelidiferens TaxID=3069689 RepID=A0ACC5NUA9_9BACT|nr:APC family permease [Edaphobacter lichenicola]MBB5338182.1 amino acid transporter [Edaphobacter lichenicola]
MIPTELQHDGQTVTLKRSLRYRDLILYGIILIQPTAPMPVFGVIYQESRGHVVMAILFALIAMLFTAYSYGRMARAYPKGGSAFTYVGEELHPALGYMTGWCMAMDYILNPLICTIWSSKAAINFIPEVPYILWVLFFAGLFTILNLRGVETSARINSAVAAGLGIVIILFVVAAVRYIFHLHTSSFAFYTNPVYDRSTFSAHSVFRGTSIAVLTYIGFDGISTLSDEAHDPSRTIPRAIILTCLITGVLASIEVYLAQLVWPRGVAFPDLDTAYVAIARRAGGPFLFALMNGALLIATIGSGMASQLGAARLLFAMGQDGALPRRFFGSLNPIRRIPQNNVLLIGAIVLAGSLAMSYQLGTELLNYGALLAFMGVNVASAVLAYRAHRTAGTNPFFPIVLSLSGFVVCFFLWLNLGATARWAGTVWATLGIALWLLRRQQMKGRTQLRTRS